MNLYIVLSARVFFQTYADCMCHCRMTGRCMFEIYALLSNELNSSINSPSPCNMAKLPIILHCQQHFLIIAAVVMSNCCDLFLSSRYHMAVVVQPETQGNEWHILILMLSGSAVAALTNAWCMQMDKPVGAEAYTCPHVGGYKLQGGQLLPFPQATAGPIMLVSPFFLLLQGFSTHLSLY